jgi:hypothetical protein
MPPEMPPDEKGENRAQNEPSGGSGASDGNFRNIRENKDKGTDPSLKNVSRYLTNLKPVKTNLKPVKTGKLADMAETNLAGNGLLGNKEKDTMM